MVKTLTFFLLLLPVLGLANELCSPTDTNYEFHNPIGTCGCEGHLWVAEGCQAAFYCIDSLSNEGCYKVRTKVRVVVTDFQKFMQTGMPGGGNSCHQHQRPNVGVSEEPAIFGRGHL